MPKVFVSLSQALPASVESPDCVVVVDVLRSGVSVATALENGAKEVRMFRTVEEARECAAALPAGTALLCGERKYLRIPGFDLSNSPLDYTRDVVEGKTVILTTTNGPATVASLDIGSSPLLLYAALCNSGATARRIMQAGCSTVSIVCAGTRSLLSLEDAVGAGAIMAALGEHELGDDGALVSQWAWQEHGPHFSERVSWFEGGKRLLALGMTADLAVCSRHDNIDLAVEYDYSTGVFKAVR